MKEVFHKIVSIAMAVLLLLSTISWKVEKHYCMGRLMDVALFTNVDTCGMDMSVSQDNQDVEKAINSCCDDQVILVDGQDDLQLSFNDLDFEQQSFLLAYSYFYNHLFQVQEEQEVLNEHYPPPILVKDIQLLDEVYLI